jgi:hypothetical protein
MGLPTIPIGWCVIIHGHRLLLLIIAHRLDGAVHGLHRHHVGALVEHLRVGWDELRSLAHGSLHWRSGGPWLGVDERAGSRQATDVATSASATTRAVGWTSKARGIALGLAAAAIHVEWHATVSTYRAAADGAKSVVRADADLGAVPTATPIMAAVQEPSVRVACRHTNDGEAHEAEKKQLFHAV